MSFSSIVFLGLTILFFSMKPFFYYDFLFINDWCTYFIIIAFNNNNADHNLKGIYPSSREK